MPDGVISPRFREIARTADATAIASDTTLANDDVLELGVNPGEQVTVELLLHVTTHGTADFKVSVAGPTGTTGVVGVNGGAPEVIGDGAIAAVEGSSADTEQIVHAVAVVNIPDDAALGAKLTAQWAQGTSNAGETNVLAGSLMRIHARNGNG